MALQTGNARGSRRPRQLAEINVTPMVDVMLVLLIIFMVAAPALQRGIRLELPQTVNAQKIDRSRLVVSIDRENHIRLNDKLIHPDLLTQRMEILSQQTPDETVFLRADKLLPYGEVLLVMDQIRSAGMTNVALVTVPREIVHEGRR
jgi:biopolymer transport protein TolR